MLYLYGGDVRMRSRMCVLQRKLRWYVQLDLEHRMIANINILFNTCFQNKILYTSSIVRYCLVPNFS